MERRGCRERTAAGIAGVVVVSFGLAGCPWSAINSTSSGEGEAAIDDSSGAMVGTYRLGERTEVSDGCEMSNGEAGESDRVVRISKIESNEGNEKGEVELRVELCGSPDSCEEPVWGATATKMPGGGAWRAREGEASAGDGPVWKRSCQMQVTTTRAVPGRNGMRIERTQRGGGVPLEGDTACRNSTAVEYVDQLRCVARTFWEGEAR